MTSSDPAFRIRAETPGDRAAVHDVLARAFPSDAEARLVDALRGLKQARVSIVAVHEGSGVIGHVLFTRVAIGGSSAASLGLGPMGVLPAFQRQGVGSALVEAGLSACRATGERIVVVLGYPRFYSRFGFRQAWDFGLYYKARGPNPSFLVCELEAGALRGRSGEVRYPAAFDAV